MWLSSQRAVRELITSESGESSSPSAAWRGLMSRTMQCDRLQGNKTDATVQTDATLQTT
jgi:hypothetical protein